MNQASRLKKSATLMKPFVWRLALRETLNSKRFAILFGLNLALGMTGFVVLDAVKSSIQLNMESRSQAIMGADISVSAYRPLTETELQSARSVIGRTMDEAREVSFMSMVASDKFSRLAEIRAIDKNFPMYGSIKLQQTGLISSGAAKDFSDSNKAWLAPELLLQLEVKLGEQIKIGQKYYVVSDVIEVDPTSSTVSFAVAPRIYVGVNGIASTGLIDKGSRISQTSLFKTPVGADVETFESQLKTVFQRSTEVRIRSHKSASEQMSRILQYLNDYLGLVALVSLFLSSIGGTYLFRSQLAKKTKEIAILLSLGASHKEARTIYVLQLGLMGFAAASITLGICVGLLPILPKLIAPFLAETILVSLSLRSMVIAFAMGIGGSVLFCLPHLVRVGRMRAALLFQEASTEAAEGNETEVRFYLPAILVWWALAIVQANSLRVGSLFVAGFVAAAVFLTLIGMLVIRGLAIVANNNRIRTLLPAWPTRLAILNLIRDRSSTISAFVAVGLGALFISLVPQLRAVISQELRQPEAGKVPAFFLFDIQDEQIRSLEEKLGELGVSLSNPSPLIRARLEAINGAAPDENFNSTPGTREREQEERFKNRMFNLSSRDRLTDSEELTAGREFSGPFDWDSGKPVEASVEERFAERLGLKLGSLMRFDVQGVSIEAAVVSLRRVRWTSFQPNFFIQVQPGVFDETPKSWVASIPARPSLDKNTIQMSVVKSFPNISVVDVGSSVERILDVIGKITTAVNVMAWLTLIVGSSVLFSIANHQAQRRKREIALIKVFGAPFSDIRKMILTEFALIGFATGLTGSMLGSGFSFAISRIVFQAPWQPNAMFPLVSTFTLLLFVVATGWLATGTSLRTKPSSLLNG